MRELEAEGHGPQRHEGQVTERQLQDRVLHGHDPAQEGPDKTVDAVTGQPHEPPRIACRFDTSEAMVAADDAVRDSMWIRLDGSKRAFAGMTGPERGRPTPSIRTGHVNPTERGGVVTQPSSDDLYEFRQVLGSHFNVDLGDGMETLKRDVARVPPPPYIGMLQRGLEHVLRHDLIARDELVGLTNRAFDSDEEARAFLQRIWDEVFA